MLETTGVKLIKTDCNKCGDFLEDSNWNPSFKRKSLYICRTCNHPNRATINPKSNPLRMFVNGRYVSKFHPLYKAGRYSSFGAAAFSALEGYEKSIAGYVYVISNPSWEGWFKVGMAVDAYDRCSQYQTSSPFRDYEVEYCKHFEDRRKAEGVAHKLLKNVEHKGEWFNTDLSVIKNAIKTIEGI